MTWDADSTARASKLWMDGLSASQIAASMGVSRNAICGLAARRRDLFPSKAKVNPRSERKRKPQSRPVTSPWTPDAIRCAAKQWADGVSGALIAATAKVSLSAFTQLAARRRDMFPARKPLRSKKAAPASSTVRPIHRVARPIETVPAFAPAEPRPSLMDLGVYRIAAFEPIAFVDLGHRQCRFPLECLETVSGPKTPCCGARTDELQSYCAAHLRKMYGRAA